MEESNVGTLRNERKSSQHDTNHLCDLLYYSHCSGSFHEKHFGFPLNSNIPYLL